MKHLNENFEDPKALFLLAFNFLKTDNTGAAYNTFLRAGELNPGEPAIWHNIGKCYHEIQDNDKADEFFRRALKAKPDYYPSLEGLSLTNTLRGKFDEVIHYANRALAENPEATESRTNRAMAYLVKGRWLEGWRDYDANLGREKNRKEMSIGDEPRWDGTKGLDIFCYGEQGIGDEISFASCLPDLVRDSKSVIIECDGRIEGLLKRSFPTCEVYGTRYKTTVPKWKEGRKVDAKVSLGQLPKFYRNKDSDFPGTPYLKPDPLLALQWRAALDSLGSKPKIGISWTGGIPKTGQKRRSVTLDTFAPLFKYDADFISLQYKEPDVKDAEDKFGVKIHDWEWGTRVANYDHTVALISQLDLVISVCTTVVHAAGGLGKDCWCLVPEVPMWRYLDHGSRFPWGGSVELFRQKGREWPTGILLGKLRDRFGDHLR